MGLRKRSLIGLFVCMLLCMQFTVPVFANGSSKKVVRFVTSWNESKGLGGKFKVKDGMDFPLSNEMVSASYMVIVDGGKSESIAVWDVTYASKSSKISAFPEVTSCGSDKLVGWVDENGNEVDERHSVKSDSVYYAVYKQGVTHQEDVGFASGSGSGSGQKPGSSDGSGSVKPNKDKPGSGSAGSGNNSNNSGSGNGSGNVGNGSGNAGSNSGGNSNGAGNTGGSDNVNGSSGNNSGSQSSDGQGSGDISGNGSEQENGAVNGSGIGGTNSSSNSDNADGGNLESGESANGADKNGSGSNSTGSNSDNTGGTSGSSDGNTDTFTITSYLFHVKELKGNIRDIRLQSNKFLKDLAEVLSFDADSYAVKQVGGDEYFVKDDMTLEELIELLTNGDVCLIGYKDKKPIGCAVFCDSLSENEFNLVMSEDTDVKLRTVDEVVNGVEGVDEGMADILNASKGSNVVRGLLIAGVVIVLLVGFLVWAFFSKKKKK